MAQFSLVNSHAVIAQKVDKLDMRRLEAFRAVMVANSVAGALNVLIVGQPTTRSVALEAASTSANTNQL
jgi:hypothetical protein